jgi:hypothetical protein
MARIRAIASGSNIAASSGAQSTALRPVLRSVGGILRIVGTAGHLVKEGHLEIVRAEQVVP